MVGFTSGRETTKGSRLLGKIGALIVDYQGKRLELSGLTDAEREFLNPDMARTATDTTRAKTCRPCSRARRSRRGRR